MKKIIIKNLDGIQTHSAEMEDPSDWVAGCVANNYWGKGERWVLASESHNPADVIERETRELSPAIDAVINDKGEEISPAIEAVVEELIKLRAEYTVEITDITQQLEQERINREALEYLASTDWLIIREMDSGIACPLEIKQARAEARARIVR